MTRSIRNKKIKENKKKKEKSGEKETLHCRWKFHLRKTIIIVEVNMPSLTFSLNILCLISAAGRFFSSIFIRVWKSLWILVIVGTNAANNTTQFDNFTIEWEDFSILTCAIPTSFNLSLFTCPMRNGSIQVQDISCLNEVTIDFDENICQPTTTVATSVAWTSMSTQQTQVKEKIGVKKKFSVTII